MPERTRPRRIGPLVVLVSIVTVLAGPAVAPVRGGTEAAASRTTGGDPDQVFSVRTRNSHLGYTSFHTGGVRYFVTELVLTNQSDAHVTMPIFPISLLCDGVEYRPDVERAKLSEYEFRVDGKLHRFKDLPRTKVLPLAPGDSGSLWLVYSALPKTPDVPQTGDSFRYRGRLLRDRRQSNPCRTALSQRTENRTARGARTGDHRRSTGLD